MAGIPPTAGFFGKFVILTTTMKAGFYIGTIYALLISVISTYYYIKVLKIIFFDSKFTKNNINFKLGLFLTNKEIDSSFFINFNIFFIFFFIFIYNIYSNLIINLSLSIKVPFYVLF